jgi:hypothetical protein
VVGAVAGAVCALAVGLKYRFGYDDSLDVVGVHLVGGLVGTLLIGLLATATRRPASTACSTAAASTSCGAGRRCGSRARFSFVAYGHRLAIGEDDRLPGRRGGRGHRHRPGDRTPRRRTTSTRLHRRVVARPHVGHGPGTVPPEGDVGTGNERKERMKLVTAVIKPHKWEDVREALETSASPA